MQRTGHYGVALAAAALPAAWLAADSGLLALLGGATVLALTMLPDADLRVPLVPHRGPTHSLAFAAAVGLAVALAAGRTLPVALGVPAPAAREFGFAVGALAVLAHLAADALTPAGVPLLWPLSDRRLSLGVTTAGSRLANWTLLALGVAIAIVATTRVAPV